jgi:hypothetical protein
MLSVLTINTFGYSQQPGTFTGTNGGMGEFDFSINYFPGLAIGEAGRKLGSEILIFEEISWVNENDLPDNIFMDERTDYGNRVSPIITRPGSGFSFMLNAGYTFNDTRFGMSYLRMPGAWEGSGEVPGLYLIEQAASEEFGYGYVNFWNMGLDLHASRNFPASWFEGFIDLDENEDGDLDFEFFPERGATAWNAFHETSMNSFLLTIGHPVLRLENIDLSITGGLHTGRWKDNLRQSMNILAHSNLVERWTQNVLDEVTGDSIFVEVLLESVFNNDITLETSSSATYNPHGAFVGLSAEWRVLPSLFLSVKAGGMALRGKAKFSGTGTDVDDIFESYSLDVFDENGSRLFSEAATGNEFLSGIFELPETTISLASVNYQLDIAARFNLTGNVSVMAGYYYSRWKNLPVSPQWKYPDQFTRPYGASALEESWETGIRTDLAGSGIRLGIGLIF